MMMPALLLWSFVLSVVWKLHFAIAIVIFAMASVTGARFNAYRSTESDQHSFYIYNVSEP